ncbi:hypothetical protein VP1G_10322 [Cytospora mali]|uniref:Uncharacterized protein n=1 Tax=Cytospora mali TaxID=578113 RepID=A0A194VGQ5_CYTMA|nr:hypothetical protein VP1G_10322 [Valsa mali var. pyri (nom. inval.)]
MAKDSTAVVGPEPTANNTKVAGAKWNDEAHQALCGTLLEVVEGAGTSWRAHLDRMVELMGEQHHKMPSVWDEARQKDLLEEIYFRTAPQLSLDDKNAIVQGMENRGHPDISWNAIRTVSNRLSELPQPERKMAPNPMYESLGFWRDLAVATYEFTAPSSAVMAQIIEKTQASGGWDINQNGL